MPITSLFIGTAAALAMCAGAAQAATQNGFANGGFEIVGAATPADSWLQAASGYSLSSDARTGAYAALLASPPFGSAIVLQNSIEQGGLADLTEGDTPTLRFWAKGTAGATGNAVFALRYLDDVGNIKANSRDVFFHRRINPTTWTLIAYNLGAVPVGATAAFIEFAQNIGEIGIGPAGEDWFAGAVLIDDVYLGVTAVPEPGTHAMLLAGLGMVGFMARCRRHAAWRLKHRLVRGVV